MTGEQLSTFVTGINGGNTMDATLLSVLIDNAKTILEEERSWVVLRKTNKTKNITTANTWQTAIDLSTITDFSRFYSEWPIVLFDGNNQKQYYRLVPFDRQLEYKDTSNTCCYDENAKILYLNGTVAFSGTLYINYVSTSPEIDIASATEVWTTFPSRFLPLLGFYAVGIQKGAIDYDSINKLMLPSNQAVVSSLKNALEKWDTEKQMSTIDHNDPTEDLGGGFRSGAINRDY